MSDRDKEAVQKFGGVILAGQASGVGNLKMSSSGFNWKSREGSRVVDVNRDEIVSLEWFRGTLGYLLRARLRGGSNVKFDGFKEVDYDSVLDYAKGVWDGLAVVRGKQMTHGWSWGRAEAVGADMTMKDASGEKEVFEIPLGEVAQVNMPSANELALEFHVDDTTGPNDECLVEMRFSIPDAEEAQQLHEAIKAKADTSAFAGESIASFDELPVILPRGRYDVDLYPSHLKLHGKSADYKILYTSISRLFLLPKPDEVHVDFVLSLDPPIRQGNTMYPHLIFHFQNEDSCTVEMKLKEADLKTKYNDRIQKIESGETWKVFSKIVRSLTGKPLHVPKTFSSTHGQRAVRTALGANDGHIFFLESSFFFVTKPPTYIRFDDIEEIEFKRMDLERRFDMAVTTLSGSSFLFSNIERTEFDNIHQYLKGKKIPLSGVREKQVATVDVEGMDVDEEESEDEDFDPEAQPPSQGADGAGRGADGEEEEDEDVDDDDLDEEFENEAASEDDVAPKKKQKKK